MNNQLTNKSNNISQRKSKNIISLIDKLKNKVNNFDVVDNQGRLIGKVKDLVVNANHPLNFVIENLSKKIIQILTRLLNITKIQTLQKILK